MKKYFVACFISIACLNACKENKIEDVKSKIRFINASSLHGDVNLYVDYQKIYATNVQYLNFSKYREYITGKRKIEIKDANESMIIDTTIALEENKAYSLVLYDSMNMPRYKQIREEYIPSGGSTCKIRFLHLSNDALNVNVTQDNNATIHFADFKNGDFSEYKIFNSGQHAFNVVGTNINYIQPFVNLSAGNFYTMYLKGNVLSTGIDSLGIFAIENNSSYE
jgi:hypothetical protein